jgi:hypothetical protein
MFDLGIKQINQKREVSHTKTQKKNNDICHPERIRQLAE